MPASACSNSSGLVRPVPARQVDVHATTEPDGPRGHRGLPWGLPISYVPRQHQRILPAGLRACAPGHPDRTPPSWPSPAPEGGSWEGEPSGRSLRLTSRITHSAARALPATHADRGRDLEIRGIRPKRHAASVPRATGLDGPGPGRSPTWPPRILCRSWDEVPVLLVGAEVEIPNLGPSEGPDRQPGLESSSGRRVARPAPRVKYFRGGEGCRPGGLALTLSPHDLAHELSTTGKRQEPRVRGADRAGRIDGSRRGVQRPLRHRIVSAPGLFPGDGRVRPGATLRAALAFSPLKVFRKIGIRMHR